MDGVLAETPLDFLQICGLRADGKYRVWPICGFGTDACGAALHSFTVTVTGGSVNLISSVKLNFICQADRQKNVEHRVK
jgi:hypothetical protein